MPIRDVQLVKGEFYHIVKRGVDGRKIFLDDEDRIRFLNSLLAFNDKGPVTWNMRAFWHQRDPASLMMNEYKLEYPLVQIHSFALMENHFHILIKQVAENGISNFMNKLGGYSYYFNKKYKRVGPLFQGRFKAVLIKTDEQLKNVFVYINTNPIGLVESSWKEKGIKDFKKSVIFLKNYKWSSCSDYMGEENFTFLIEKSFFINLFGNISNCKKEIESWLKYKVEVSKYKDIALE